MLMEQYKISIKKGQRTRQLIWMPKDALELDHNLRLFVEKTDNCVWLVQKTKKRGDTEPRKIPINDEQLIKGVPLKLKIGSTPRMQMQIRVLRLKPIRPSFLPWNPDPSAKGGRLFLYSGIHHHALNSFPMEETYYYCAKLSGKRAFSVIRSETGVKIVAHRDGVALYLGSGKRRALNNAMPIKISTEDFHNVTLLYQSHWWFFVRTKRPAPTQIIPSRERDLDELDRVKRLGSLSGGLMVILLMLSLIWPKPKAIDETAGIEVTIDSQKILPKPPEEKKIEKPKLAEKHPTRKPAPPRQAIHTPPPLARKTAMPKNPKNAAKSAMIKTRGIISRSLGFLTSSSQKAMVFNAQYDNTNKQYQRLADLSFPVVPDQKYLMKKGEDMSLPPSIATRSSRAVASNASTGYSRGLDGVQGKVGLGSLYGSAGGGFSENSLAASGGLSMSGAGRLSEALILAALSKRLHKFQYCYEKALLGDPQLAGNIMMEWVIHPGGQATSVRVVRSQLNRSALHSCIGSEISTIRFPSPQGGSVTVKYPFNFSSTSL